jgi:serine/threonine protein phosphatase PrpC
MPLPKKPSDQKSNPTISIVLGNSLKEKGVIVAEQLDNECIALSCNLTSFDFAGEYVVKTALWYYQQSKRKPYLWKNKELFGQRLIHSLNRSLCKEKDRLQITKDISVTFAFLCIRSKFLHLYHVGEIGLFLVRDNEISKLYPSTEDRLETQFSTLGNVGQIDHHLFTQKIQSNDLYIIVSAGVYSWITLADVQECMHNNSTDGMQLLMERAAVYGSPDNKAIMSMHIENS